MADFTLVAGVDVQIDTGNMRAQLQNALAEINKNPVKIKVQFDETSLASMKSQISSILTGMKVTKVDNNMFSGMITGAKEATIALKEVAQAQKELNASGAQRGKTTLNEESVIRQYTTAINQAERALRNYTAAKNSQKASSREEYANIKTTAAGLRNLLSAYNSGQISLGEFKSKVSTFASSLKTSEAAIKSNGDATKSWSDRMGGLAAKFGSWLTVSQVIMYAVRSVKKMVSASVELDSAMTQMQIVTKASSAAMKEFGDNAADAAQRTASKIADIVDSATTYARLGYDMDDSTQLAEYTAMLQNVGDIDVSEAQNAITAIIKAYDIDAGQIESVMDKLVETGNNFPISVSQIAEGMNNASSTLAASGNTFEQSVALLTAANTTIQDAAKSSTGLRTIAARIRNTKTELDELGEVMTEANYEELVSNLTKAGVKLTTVNGEYRSTYDIMADIAAKWDEMSSMEQAGLATALSGTRQQAVFYSIIGQFKEASGAMDAMANSAGALDSAYSVYLDSTQAHVDQLKATFQELSSNLFTGDFMKFFVDTGNGVLTLLNNIMKLINALGGMKTVLVAVSGIVLALKLDAIKGMLTSLWTTIVKFGSGIGEFVAKLKLLPVAMEIAKSQGKGLSAALNAVGFSASAAQVGIMALTAVLTIAIAAYSNWRQKIEEQRQESIDAAETASDEINNIFELYNAYRSANAAYESNSGSKEALTESTNALLAALGYEQSEIDKLVHKYDSLDDAINNVTTNALADAVTKAKSGYNAAYDNLMDEFGNGEDFGKNFSKFMGFDDSMLDWMEDTPAFGNKIGELLSNAGLIGEGSYNQGGIMLLENDNLEEVLASYEKLLQARKLLQENLSDDEYKNSDAVDKIDGAISKYEKVISEYNKSKETYNDSLAKQEVFGEISQNGIPKTVGELNKMKEAYIANQKAGGEFVGTEEEIAASFDKTINEMSKAYPELADVVNRSRDIPNQVSEIYKQANEQISQSAEKAGKSASSIVSDLTDVQQALSAQKAGKSIALEDYDLDSIGDYRKALEYVNGSMQLNADKVREIAQAKAEEQIEINNTNKALEQAKYLENAKQIEEYRQKLKDANFENGETAESVQASIDALLDENNSIADLCQQYDYLSQSLQEAVGAYQNWLNSQDSSDYGDMADDAVSAIQRIRDTYDKNSDIFGNYGSKKFDAAVEFIIPDSVDQEDLSAIESYMADFKQYLKFDDKGAVEGLNVDKFLENAVDAGLMSYSEDEGFKVLGGKKMEDFAEGMNLSTGVVQAMFDELQLKGADFDWSDETVKTIGDLAVEANQAAEQLKSIDEYSDLKIKMDVSDLPTTEEQISALDATIEEMNGVKAKVDVDSSEAEHANSVIQYCLTQKQLLSQPDVMRVDTSQVEGEVGKAILLMQEFVTAQNDLEIQAAVGADTTEAQAKVDSLSQELQGLSNDTKIKVGLDTTSTENIKSSIQSITAKTLTVKAGIDASAITGYNPGTKSCNVVYNPKTDALPTSFDAINRDVNYVPHTGSLPDSFNTITRYVNYVKTGDVPKVNGTAHADGTAKAGGDWGTAGGGTTLVGELGREIVVDPHTGQWYTVGDFGAEFVNIPKGAIVFNHKQTESLLDNGYVTGRASALVSGTAMVRGGYKPYSVKKSSTSRSAKKSSTSRSGKKSGKKSGKSDSSEKEKEALDWIEIKLERIERQIKRLEVTAESTFNTLAQRNNALNKEISKVSHEIDVQQKAYDRYMKEANSVGLKKSLRTKVQNGTININEYSDKTAEKIEEYQKWYEKALDCSDAIQQLKEDLKELYETKFNNIADDYENQLSLIEHLTKSYDIDIDKLVAKGLIGSSKYLEAKKNTEQQNITTLKAELKALQTAFSNAVNKGDIKKNSEAWYKMQQEINDVKEAIGEAQVEVLELNKAIRELDWEFFDFLEEQISRVVDEADFLIDLMSHGKLFEDNGQATDEGMATIGLHGVNYDVYMRQADDYAVKIAEINKQLANDPTNTDLINQKNDYIDAQQEAILAAEEEKDAIVDLVREGIELELDALQDLIDKRKDAIDAAKDQYDYQKKINEQTKELATLQKRMSAYQGDTSEENKAAIQKLRLELTEAQEDLEETEYEHMISEQKAMLDNLYDEYELILNERLDNVDQLITEMTDIINQNQSDIYATLQGEAQEVGYVMSEEMQKIWSDTQNPVLSTYFEGFKTDNASVLTVLGDIKNLVDSIKNKGNTEAKKTVANTTKTTKETKQTKKDAKKEIKKDTKKKDTKKSSGGDGKAKVGDKVKYESGIYHATSDGTGATGHQHRGEKLYITKINNASWAKYPYHLSTGNKLGKGDLGWVKLSQISGYSQGGYVGGLKHITAKNGDDLISINTLKRGEAVLTPEQAEMFSKLVAELPVLSTIVNSLSSSNSDIYRVLTGDSPGAIFGDININIPIDHVENYNDFIKHFQKDKQVEKLIRSMSVDLLAGKSALAKHKYNWK